jgi:hypothetical protein
MDDLVEVEFLRCRKTRTVHVVVGEAERVERWRRVRATDLIDDEPWLHLTLGPVLCRCGYLGITMPPGQRDEYTDSFEDDELCRTCYKTIPSNQAHRLFEHDCPSTDALESER